MVTHLLDALNRRGSSLATRLAGGRHPKHSLGTSWHHWYLPYLKPDDWVLDVGCGTGAHAIAALPRARVVIGVDQSVTATLKALTTPGLAFIKWDITTGIPAIDGYVDVVLCLDVIEHIEDRKFLLDEIARVLKPNGLLLISAPNADTSWRKRLKRAGLFAFSDADHKVEYGQSEFLQELYRGGFTLEARELMPVVYDTPLAGLIDLVGVVSLPLYRRLMEWKRRYAVLHPEESTGFRAVARRRA